MANGFPNQLMKQGDIFVSRDLMEILGLSVGELILMKYDLLAFLPDSLSSFESIIFDYKPTKSGMPT